MVAGNKVGWHSGTLYVKNIEGNGTGSDGAVIKNLKNTTASSLSGTQRDIEINIGGTAYYFTVYPTKA